MELLIITYIKIKSDLLVTRIAFTGGAMYVTVDCLKQLFVSMTKKFNVHLQPHKINCIWGNLDYLVCYLITRLEENRHLIFKQLLIIKVNLLNLFVLSSTIKI